MQQKLKDLSKAFKDGFDKKQKNKRLPRFKKKGLNDSFRYPQGVKVKDKMIFLPKIGYVGFFKSRDIVGTIKNTTITKKGSHWYVSIQTEFEQKDKAHIKHQLVGLAPSGAAVKELQEVLGDKNAQTLQGFLAEYAGYAEGRGTNQGKLKEAARLKNHIFVIDEASMMSSKLIQDYLSVARSLNLKTVLMGDNHQLLGVEEGNPFFQLQKNGAEMVTMAEIIRQKTDQGKSISYAAYANDIHKVFEKIGSNVLDCSEQKGVEKVENIDTALATAKLYMSFSKEKRDGTLILAQANQSKNLVNSEIREMLKAKGELGEQSVKIKTFVNKNPTVAEREYTKNYSSGEVILFNKRNPYFNIEKNEYFEIKSINHDKSILTLESLNDKEKKVYFNPSISKSFRKHIELYKTEQKELRQNDKIMFTRKVDQKDASFVNSTVGQVKSITKSGIDIEVNGKEYKFNSESLALRHIDYSYCRTTHKGQGLTTKNSIILTESWWKFLTTQRDLLVQATRQKEEIHVVVDSKKEVLNTILKQNEAIRSSLDFAKLNNKNLEKEYKINKSDFENLGGELERTKFNLANKQSQKYVNKKQSHRTTKTYLVPEIPDSEVKQKFKEFVQDNIGNSDFKNLDNAIDRAFSQQGRAAYFGEKQKGVVCWYGEAGYTKHFKYNAGEVFSWGKGNIQNTDRINYKTISAEEKLKIQKENELKLKNNQIQKENEYSEAAKKAQHIFANIPVQNREIEGKGHDYLKAKGLKGAHRIKEFKFSRFDLKDQKTGGKIKNTQLIVPLRNIKGEIESFQYINSHDHRKGFMREVENLEISV